MFGAIVVTGIKNLDRNLSGGSSSFSPPDPVFANTSIECVELLGRSVLQWTIDSLRAAGVESISLISESDQPGNDRISAIAKHCGVPLSSSRDPWPGVIQKAKEYEQSGVETLLLLSGGAYIELDLRDLVQFHGEKGRGITSIHDAQGQLAAWLVDAAYFRANQFVLPIDRSLSEEDYTIRGYVNRLDDSLDLRCLVVDSLRSRCQFHPDGREVQPAVWIADGAEVHRTAGLIAPIYIGASSSIGQDCLIAEGSNIERDCEIDDGTTVSDSTVLQNSYVGIGLEICRSIVNGCTLQSLEHQATVTISDAAVMRSHRPADKELIHPASAPASEDQQVLLSPAEEGAS